MIVCLCHPTSDRDVDAMIDDGARTIEEIGRRCGAGTGCGTCVGELRERLASKGVHSRLFCRPRLGKVALSVSLARPPLKSSEEVLTLLNQLLTNELTAINQYFVHAKMCQNWGYERLAVKLREESIDEMRHADEVIGRILFLEGVPNMQRYNKLHVGETVREQMESDLQLEYSAIAFLNQGIAAARKVGDNATEDMMTKILVSEEAHTDWIETQLELIRQVGEQNYLAQQLRK